MVDALLAGAGRVAPDEPEDWAAEGRLTGLLVPHAGLAYSGMVAATAWRLAGWEAAEVPLTVVLLGTNHGAGWLDGVAVWETGAWTTPLGALAVDTDLAGAIVELGAPFAVDRAAHLDEHSIEVQLPILGSVRPDAGIVPLSVGAGTGRDAIDAGRRLGAVLAARRGRPGNVLLAISTDMAHYPPALDAERITEDLLPFILGLDAPALASAERAALDRGTLGLACGMCGIEPAVLGLAALQTMGTDRAARLATATSADAGGPTDRTVGYLAAAFGARARP